MKPSQRLFHQISVKDYVYTPDSGVPPAQRDDDSTARFLGRFGGRLDFAGKSVLDIGCGSGALCAAAARAGATEVVGVELDTSLAMARLRERYSDVAERVELVQTEGGLEELARRQFDLVISKDAMEHYPDPEAFVHLMTPLLKPGGELAIGFSPLWKSPTGGHIEFMTPVPWAHLIFSEQTIMAERRRFRPDEEAERFEDIKGGLNKMTYKRFRTLMASTGLQPTYFETNVSDNTAVKAMKAIAKFPPLREYFTQSIYSVWRKPAEG